MIQLIVFASAICMFAGFHLARGESGIITSTTGGVDIFYSGATRTQVRLSTPQVIYQGEKLFLKPAKVGERVFSGDIVHTGIGAKVKIILSNSEQIYIGPSTSLRIVTSANGTKVDLGYGQIRSVVPGGSPPFTGKAQGAVIGVRGTDFSWSSNPADNTARLQVLRGKVALSEENSKIEKMVTTGQEVNATFVGVERVQLSEPKAISKESIQVLASLTEQPPPLAKSVSVLVMAEIQQVEKTAVEKTISSLAREDPQLYEALKASPPKDLNSIHEKTTNTAATLAPSETKATKKLKDEVQPLGDEVYK